MKIRISKKKKKHILPHTVEKLRQNHEIFDVHIWGTYVHMYTKYEVSMSNPVPGGGVHR